jgi:hypothetical protein
VLEHYFRRAGELAMGRSRDVTDASHDGRVALTIARRGL